MENEKYRQHVLSVQKTVEGFLDIAKRRTAESDSDMLWKEVERAVRYAFAYHMEGFDDSKEEDYKKLDLKADDVKWVVNDAGELGVQIGDRYFFLYKGDSLVYGDDPGGDTEQIKVRPVFKREFGECCISPLKLKDTSEKYEDNLEKYFERGEWKVIQSEL